MSANRIEVWVLQCDQGMGTLVKIFEDVSGKEELTKLALIDLGSELRTKAFADDAVEEVLSALEEMPKPEMSLLVLSHQDYDHWSLLPLLQKRIEAKYGSGKLPPCRQFVRGGQRWKPSALKAVTNWEGTFHVASKPLPRAFSDYEDPAAGLTELADLGGALFRVLAVNVPWSRSADDLIRNGTSAVITVEFGDTNVVLPGDATADTLAFINEIIAEWDNAGKGNPVSPCHLVTAPHHGALRTIAGNFTTTMPDLDIAEQFSDDMAADNVAASAGYLSSFYHPFKIVMETLGAHVGDDADDHTYVVWDEANNVWEAVEDTDRNIYTTICSLDDPPERTSWFFEIDDTGAFTPTMVRRTAAGRTLIPLRKRARRNVPVRPTPEPHFVARPAAERATAPRQTVLAARPQAAVSRTEAT